MGGNHHRHLKGHIPLNFQASDLEPNAKLLMYLIFVIFSYTSEHMWIREPIRIMRVPSSVLKGQKNQRDHKGKIKRELSKG